MTKQRVTWIVLFLIAITIKVFSFFPDAVERYYSNGIYPFTSRVQRWLFGWLPFSVGDLFYALIVLYLIYKIVDFFKRLSKGQVDKEYRKKAVQKFIKAILIIYISFNLLWGLNYNRRGITYQLELPVVKVTREELVPVMEQLVHKINGFDTAGKMNRQALHKEEYLFRAAINSYKNLGQLEPFLTYSIPSVKPSLFLYMGNYLGYTGYYNPFTGEGQVNTKVPLFLQPFTTCHEIGHQLGYAKENEANFAGYLAAKSSGDSAFLYSVYFELYGYSRPYLYILDSGMLRKFDSQLQPGVKKDFSELKTFLIRYENPLEKLIDRLYGRYLKLNEQPSGKITYSEVIIWLIAYNKKFGISSL